MTMTIDHDGPDHIDPAASEPSRQVTNSTQERNEMRRRESLVGLVPGVIALFIIAMIGLIYFLGSAAT